MLLNGQRLRAKTSTGGSESPVSSGSRSPTPSSPATSRPISPVPPLNLDVAASVPVLHLPPSSAGPVSPHTVSPVSPRSMAKLPLLVPRASVDGASKGDWATGDSVAQPVSPRVTNPSRSPRPNSRTAAPVRHPSTSDETEAPPPRPIKNPDLDNLKQRGHVCKEIVSTEEVYVQTLQTILKVYREPLENDRILSEEECAGVFLNTNQLLERHVALLSSLRALEDHETIGSVLSAGLMTTLSLYKLYIVQFNKAGDMLRSLGEERKVAKVLAELSHTPDTLKGVQALELVRVAPVQRLPRYVLMLKEVIRFTPTTHPDSRACVQLVTTIENMLLNLNRLSNSYSSHF